MMWFRSNRHLAPSVFVDLLDGSSRPRARRHLARCASCADLLAALAATRREADRIIEVPEPPAGFWDRLSARVAIGAEAITPSAEPRAPRATVWVRLVPVGVVVVAVVAVAAVSLWRVPRPALPAGEPVGRTVVARGGDAVGVETAGLGPLEDEDGAWDVVLALAEEVDLEEAVAVGLGPTPGSTECAVAQLSAEERVELVRLIRGEIGSE